MCAKVPLDASVTAEGISDDRLQQLEAALIEAASREIYAARGEV